MFDDRIYDIVKNDPSLNYLLELADKGIVVISPNVENYQNDPEQIELLGYVGKKTISRQFIIDIMTHEDTFDKIRKIFANNLHINVIFIGEKGEFKNQYNLRKMEIIEILQKINVQEFPAIIEHYNELMDIVNYEKYKEKTKDAVYKINIDGEKYEIPISSIHQLMDLESEQFNDILINNKSFANMPLPVFLYAVSSYYKDNEILDNYLVPPDLSEKLKEIKSSKKVDVQMINKYLTTNDTFLSKINVNSELQDYIFSNLPVEFSDLEKAIYIYIMLCKKFTYDEEFFVVNQLGPLSEKHKKLENIANISLSNNKVVCYEFDVIYAYFLNQLGINYKHFISYVYSNGKETEEAYDEDYDSYSEGHTFLKFRWEKFLIKADSVTSILQGDIAISKLNQPLKGLKCENTNEQTREEFDETVSKVYQYIAERENKISQNEPEQYETFEDVVREFAGTTDKLKPLDFKERLNILYKKINSTGMIGIDAYSYLLQLRKILFLPQEQKDNIKISIIREAKKNEDNEEYAKALAIISTRLPNEKGDLIIQHYLFKPGFNLEPITKEELDYKFEKGVYSYIDSDDPKIPGIKR